MKLENDETQTNQTGIGVIHFLPRLLAISLDLFPKKLWLPHSLVWKFAERMRYSSSSLKPRQRARLRESMSFLCLINTMVYEILFSDEFLDRT